MYSDCYILRNHTTLYVLYMLYTLVATPSTQCLLFIIYYLRMSDIRMRVLR
jgi:hypothetical protein